jgi:hypothetical protein
MKRHSLYRNAKGKWKPRCGTKAFVAISYNPAKLSCKRCIELLTLAGLNK